MRISYFFVALAAPILITGCTVPGKYAWGNYDRSLYNYYKNPTQSEEHLAELESIIQSTEKTQGRIAPGIYAEYGYFLMLKGKSNEAVAQFEKEKAKWPESTQLMNNMIRIANTQSTKPLASKE